MSIVARLSALGLLLEPISTTISGLSRLFISSIAQFSPENEIDLRKIAGQS
jgi:hypothetical protein